jgi:hypothetical protein
MNNIDFVLANAANTLQTAMRDSCTIQRNSLSGGNITTTTTVTTKALVLNSNKQSATVEDWQGNIENWPVLLPLGTSVKEGDILIIKGQRMEVQKVKEPVGFVVCEEVEASGVHG